jgi:hypothetical protein
MAAALSEKALSLQSSKSQAIENHKTARCVAVCWREVCNRCKLNGGCSGLKTIGNPMSFNVAQFSYPDPQFRRFEFRLGTF